MEYLGGWASDGMQASGWLDETMLYLRLTGLVTLQGYYQAAAFAAGASLHRPFASSVVDARKALPVISAASFATASPSLSALAVKWRPGAFVVSKEHEEEFIRLAFRLADHGLERMVFTSGNEAVAWARQVATRARVKAALRASKLMLEAQPEFSLSEPGELPRGRAAARTRP